MTKEKIDPINIETLLVRLYKLETEDLPNVRDFFATSALSILGKTDVYSTDPTSVAAYCYNIADAMLEQKHKK